MHHRTENTNNFEAPSKAIEMKINLSDIDDEDDLDEEPGEVIDSAPPLMVGEEREISSSGIKKLLLKSGLGWETPEFGDEVTVHYVGMLQDGTKFDSTRDKDQPYTFKLGHGQVFKGLDSGIITMKKGETALFTLPSDTEYRNAGCDSVPVNSIIQLEVELVSFITVVDLCKDGGIIKRIMEKGQDNRQPSDLDEVLVKYQMSLLDGTVVAKTAEEGIEFYLKDGHLIPALPKVIRTMKMGEKVNLSIKSQYGYGDAGRDSIGQFTSVPPDSELIIYLELVSFKSVIDVTGDSKVIKKIIKEGEGLAVANEGAAVTVRYIAKLEDGTILEKKGFDGEAPLEFIIDEEQVLAGLDRAAATMKKGEQAILTVSPEYGFCNVEVKRDLATIPPSSNIVYEVEMLNFVKEKAPWEMSSQERIEAAGRKKEEGNLLFKSGKYQRAGKKYDKAVDYLIEEGSFGDEELKLAKPLRVSCWLNGAACCLKLNDFNDAIKLCSKVLAVEFYNVKALYRRAQAFMENADLVSAECDIKKALEVDPHNREVKLLHRSLKQHQAESNRRDAKLYTSMFSHLSKETAVAAKKRKAEKEEDEKTKHEAVAMELDSVSVNSDAADNGKVVGSLRQ